MVTLLRTDSKHIDFITLVQKLDHELAIRDGDDHAFYDQFNKIDLIRHALVVHDGDMPVACGAIKEFAPGMMEIKRMYTLPDYRGKGIATKILTALEKWVLELNYEKCILETGKKQPEAIALYKKNGYKTIPNYGQYAGVDNSVCFEKHLIKIDL
ncbi:MAG: GNAT family N-acetyltransferase [Bacteroidia bacterium]|nr:GNAT family N-acetyltransferase [Bacteroidia bacterium]